MVQYTAKIQSVALNVFFLIKFSHENLNQTLLVKSPLFIAKNGKNK